jgi:peptide chain release factor 1
MHIRLLCVLHLTSSPGTPIFSFKFKPDGFFFSYAADHRTKINYDLNKVLEGGLEEDIQAMVMLDQQEQLQALADSAGKVA